MVCGRGNEIDIKRNRRVNKDNLFYTKGGWDVDGLNAEMQGLVESIFDAELPMWMLCTTQRSGENSKLYQTPVPKARRHQKREFEEDQRSGYRF